MFINCAKTVQFFIEHKVLATWPEQRERGPSEGYFTTPAVTLVTSHSMATLKNPMKSSKLP